MPYFVKCENDTSVMQELMCFSAFLYQYIEFFVFLKVARRGAIAPLAPLNPPLKVEKMHLAITVGFSYYVLYQHALCSKVMFPRVMSRREILHASYSRLFS